MTKTVNGKWDSELARLSTYWSARNGKWLNASPTRAQEMVKWDSELARLSTYWSARNAR